DDPRGAAGGGRSGYVCPVAQSHPAASGPTPPGSSSGISAASARPAATASGDAAPVAVTAETGAPGTGDQRAGAAEDSPAATARAADSRAADSRPMEPGRVLEVFLVDDHEIVRRGLIDLLDSDPGLKVTGEAGDVASAREGIRRARPDVAVLDV